MLGLEDYGSGSENENENTTSSSKKSSLVPTKLTVSHSPATSSTSTVSLPPPRSKRAPKKITIGLPTLTASDDNENDDLKNEKPPTKKPRLGSGAGLSSLLSMLPAPKQRALPVPERVLGGGSGPGLVFRTSQTTTGSIPHPHNGFEPDRDANPGELESHPSDEEEVDVSEAPSSSISLLPLSLTKGRSNISVEEGVKFKFPTQKVSSSPPVDFFSLAASPSSSAKYPDSSNSSTHTPPMLSSAPVIPTFTPPTPTPTDPYPGFFQLPSGAWKAHDPEYYATFMKEWETKYNEHIRTLEKGMVKGFEGVESAAVEEVDAMKEMENAKLAMRDREEKKAVTKGAAGGLAAPRMNINAAKLGTRARSRHQLSTLLSEAFENREALEEKIAEGRRNRKEAGNKYGF